LILGRDVALRLYRPRSAGGTGIFPHARDNSGAFHISGSRAQPSDLNLSLNPNLMNTLFDHEKLFDAGGLNRANSDYRMHEGD
jgi:hypothetical protein